MLYDIENMKDMSNKSESRRLNQHHKLRCAFNYPLVDIIYQQLATPLSSHSCIPRAFNWISRSWALNHNLHRRAVSLHPRAALLLRHGGSPRLRFGPPDIEHIILLAAYGIDNPEKTGQ